MTPTLSQLEAMTDDELNAMCEKALGTIADAMRLPIPWFPATNIADAMWLPMPEEYAVDYFKDSLRITRYSGEDDDDGVIEFPCVAAPRTLEGEARARTIMFLMTRSKP